MCNWRTHTLGVLLILGFLCAACSGVLGEDTQEQAIYPNESTEVSKESDIAKTQSPNLEVSDSGDANHSQTQEALVEKDVNLVVCDDDAGRIEQQIYPGYLSGDSTPVLVYLPPCYDPYLQVYPVIFLLHGKPQDEWHWVLLGINEMATQGILSGQWPPFVLVMPRQPEPLFSQTDGGSGSLEQEIMEGLVPFVLDRYAVTGKAEQWAIAGISRGGVWALEISLRNPDQFQRVGALSPALNVNYPKPEYDPFLIANDAAEVPERVFLGVGDVDSARAKTEEFAGVLDDVGVHHHLQVVEGNHESTTWVKLLPDLIFFLTQDW